MTTPLDTKAARAMTSADFRLGAQAARDMLARFVECAGHPIIAASIRANWSPSWGADPGPVDSASGLPESPRLSRHDGPTSQQSDDPHQPLDVAPVPPPGLHGVGGGMVRPPDGLARRAQVDTKAARAICEAATEGPWEWFGNTKMHDVYLATTHSGRRFVMDFARWGMTGGQPRFQLTLEGDPGGGIMRSLGELGKGESPLGPKFEVSYRRQFTGIGHPDAQFIAAARSLLPAALDEIDRLRGLLAQACGDTGGTFAAQEATKIREEAGL